MLTEEMKLTKHHKLYAEQFGIDVLMTHSQPIESTQGTHKTPSAPRPPNPEEQQGESSAAKKYLIIRIPKRKKPDPETPILTADQEDPGTRINLGVIRKDYRSPRIRADSLSSDKEELKDLTAFEPTSSSLTPKPKTSRSKHIKGAIARISGRCGLIFQHMKKSFMPRKDMDAISTTV
ncbi:hypothetical protein Tco_0651942 [Tanacetum coccineum]|uniref:Uncharacterized protein n=1 Tax=Tanacetum coccineum TaxID=301880 RepID=A0ABQ4WWH5_9ASTR